MQYYNQLQQRHLTPAMDSGFGSPDMFLSQQQHIFHRQQSTPAPSSGAYVLNIPEVCDNAALFASPARHSLEVENSAAAVYPSAGHALLHRGHDTSLPAPLQSPAYHSQPAPVSSSPAPAVYHAYDASHLLVDNSSSNLAPGSALPPPQQVVRQHIAAPAHSSSRHVGFSDATPRAASAESIELMRAVTHWPKLPDFKPHNPDLWFTLVEGIFAHCKMDDSSKFLCLMSALCNHENLIIDLVGMPDTPDRYERVKSTILHRLGRTVAESVRKILHGVNMGKRTPSELWRYLRAIARPSVISDDALRTIWQDKLPAHVGLTLSNAPYAPLDQTLESADRIFASYKRYGGLRGLLSFDPGALYKVEQPTEKQGKPDSSRGRGRGRGRGRLPPAIEAPPGKAPGTDKKIQIAALPASHTSPSPDYSSDDSDAALPHLASSRRDELPLSHRICYFHYRFGASARQCRPPCQYPNARRE